MPRDIAFDLAEYAANIQYDQLPASAIAATKKDIFDSLATGLAGSSVQGVRELLDLAESWGGTPQATTFVFGKKFPANVTAMINTVMIHGYDYDDTHDVAMMHCGNLMVSCALAAAEMVGGVSGKDLIAAITAGLDIHCRLGIATTVGIVESGYIYTPLLGVFGAAATAGRIMGLTPAQMVNAFGIAYSQAAGNMQAVRDSGWTKRIQPGFASRAGIVACEMAKRGVVGAQNTFQGMYGLYHVYLHDRYDPAVITKDLGKVFTHEDLAFKPWPCGRPNQPPINACIEARARFHLDPAQIRHVNIYTNEHLYSAACTPKEMRQHPTAVVEGQFSIPYSAACALVNGKVGLSDYTLEGIRRPDVLAMAAKIDGVVDPEIEKAYHARVCPVRVEIELNDGTVLTHSMEYTLGCKEKPMADQDFLAKMDDCVRFAALSLPKDTAEHIRTLIDGLDELADSNELVKAMTVLC